MLLLFIFFFFLFSRLFVSSRSRDRDPCRVLKKPARSNHDSANPYLDTGKHIFFFFCRPSKLTEFLSLWQKFARATEKFAPLPNEDSRLIQLNWISPAVGFSIEIDRGGGKCCSFLSISALCLPPPPHAKIPCARGKYDSSCPFRADFFQF